MCEQNTWVDRHDHLLAHPDIQPSPSGAGLGQPQPGGMVTKSVSLSVSVSLPQSSFLTLSHKLPIICGGRHPLKNQNILQSANEYLIFKTYKNNYYWIKTSIISSEHTDRWLLLILQGMGLGLIRAYLPEIRVCPGLESLLETRKHCFLAFSRGLLLSLGYGFFLCLQSQTQYLSGKDLSHISLWRILDGRSIL